MKIKSSANSISADIAMLIMCFGIIIACPLRIFQMLKNIDSVTGFYNGGNATVIILYAVLALASLLILVLTFLSANVPASVVPKGRHIPMGLASAVFAATLFYDGISAYIPQASESTATIIQNAQTVSTLKHIQAVFAILSCCYFVVFFISNIAGKALHKNLRIIALAPLAWAIVRVLERLTVIINILRVSELFLEICALIFMMIFFLAFARSASEINSKGTMWSAISCGAIASMFIITFSVPRLMLMVTGNSARLVNGYPFSFADAGAMLFMIVFIITTLRCGYKEEDIKEMNEETASAQSEQEENRNQEETPEETPVEETPVTDEPVAEENPTEE